MKQHRIIWILAAILVLLILPACSHTEVGPLPAVPLYPPVKEITCIAPETMPTLLPAGYGRMLACWCDYNGMVTHLRMVNIASDTVVAAVDMDGCLDLFPERFGDHSYVLRDSEAGEWVFLSPELEEQSRMQANLLDGFFSHDRTKFYYIQDRILFCTDIATGNTAPVELTKDLRFAFFAGFDPKDNTVALYLYTSPLTTNCGIAILDLDQNAFTMMGEDLYQVCFGDADIQLLRFDEDAMQYELLFGNQDNAMRISASDLTRFDELTTVSGSDWFLGAGDNSVLFRLSEQGTTACKLSDYGLFGALRDACWSEEDALLLGSVWQSGVAMVYAVCPGAMTFSDAVEQEAVDTPIAVDVTIAQSYWGILSGESLPENLKELGVFADQLEQAYGVEIFLSDQCEDLARYSNRTLVMTDQMQAQEEVEAIRIFLLALDHALSLYPKDYFRQFRSSAGDGGICFLPVAEIISYNQVVGLCYEANGWNVIALDCHAENKVSCICHELWHATENMIVNMDYAVFRDEHWQRFNPAGFQYNEQLSDTPSDSYRWTMFDGTDEVFFIDTYARTNDREDRARLMEYVMAEPNYWNQIKTSPWLMAKLEFIFDAVNRSFDTTAWENMPWSPFLAS